MKAVTMHGLKDVRVEDVPRPELQEPTDVILRMTTAAICGSDLHLYHDKMPGLLPGSVVGHEFLGVVEEVGAVGPSEGAARHALRRRLEYVEELPVRRVTPDLPAVGDRDPQTPFVVDADAIRRAATTVECGERPSPVEHAAGRVVECVDGEGGGVDEIEGRAVGAPVHPVRELHTRHQLLDAALGVDPQDLSRPVELVRHPPRYEASVRVALRVVEAGILPDEIQATALGIDGRLGNDVASAQQLLRPRIDHTSRPTRCERGRLDVGDGLACAPRRALVKRIDHLGVEDTVSSDEVEEVEQYA